MRVKVAAAILLVVVAATACIPLPYDFDDDGQVEYGYVDGQGRYWVFGAASPFFTPAAPGISVPGDYDGDLVYEPAVVDVDTGLWFIEGELLPRQFGPEDVEPGTSCPDWTPVPGNYDAGDTDWELAWFQICDAVWYVEGRPPLQFGIGSAAFTDPPEGPQDIWWDVPVPGDYDGDEETDIAVFRVLDGTYREADGTVLADFSAVGYPVPANYDPGTPGDEPGLWAPGYGGYLVAGALAAAQGPYGLLDIPIPADYDGDGAADLVLANQDSGDISRLDGGLSPGSTGGLGPTTLVPWLRGFELVRLNFVVDGCLATLDPDPLFAGCPPGVDPPTG